MDCTETRQRLDAYLDQELDLPAVVALDEHLVSCGACQGIFASQSALQAGVRRHATYYAAPQRPGERVRAGINNAERPARLSWHWARLPQWTQLGAAVAAGAVLSWMAALEYASPREDELLTEQVINGHARSVVTQHLADVASSDQHTVKPWLSSRLDFSPPVSDLAAVGFPLLGGRVDYIGNRSVAALVYRHREHLIDVFVWPDRKADRTAPIHSESRQGYNVVRWTDGGLAFWVISDLNAAEMKAFVEAYAAAKGS